MLLQLLYLELATEVRFRDELYYTVRSIRTLIIMSFEGPHKDCKTDVCVFMCEANILKVDVSHGRAKARTVRVLSVASSEQILKRNIKSTPGENSEKKK